MKVKDCFKVTTMNSLKGGGQDTGPAQNETEQKDQTDEVRVRRLCIPSAVEVPAS